MVICICIYAYYCVYWGLHYVRMSCESATRPRQRLKITMPIKWHYFFLLPCVCSNFGKRTVAIECPRIRSTLHHMHVIASQRRVLGVNEKLTFSTQIDTWYTCYYCAPIKTSEYPRHLLCTHTHTGPAWAVGNYFCNRTTHMWINFNSPLIDRCRTDIRVLVDPPTK